MKKNQYIIELRGEDLKKFFSALFTLLIFLGIGASFYLFPDFYNNQFDKLRGIYYVYKGDKAYRDWHLQKAINYYNSALRFYPAHYSAWYNLGNIYVAYEDYFSAADAYEQAVEHNPKFIPARMNYGIISTEKLGDFDGAISQYNEIITLKKRLFSIPFVFSNKKSTKYNKGLAYYNKGVAYKQKSIYSGDDIYLQQKYLLEALDAYKNAVKILKKDYDARYNLALTYHMLGNYREAGLNYCKAIELSPLQYDAHYNLAVLLRSLRHYKESLEELEKATSLVMNSDGAASNRQTYIFDVMNDVTRTILANQDSSFVEKIGDEPSKTSKVTYVNGKLVSSEEMDKAIMKNFGVCSAEKIIKEEMSDEDTEYDTVRYGINIPFENN